MKNKKLKIFLVILFSIFLVGNTNTWYKGFSKSEILSKYERFKELKSNSKYNEEYNNLVKILYSPIIYSKKLKDSDYIDVFNSGLLWNWKGESKSEGKIQLKGGFAKLFNPDNDVYKDTYPNLSYYTLGYNFRIDFNSLNYTFLKYTIPFGIKQCKIGGVNNPPNTRTHVFISKIPNINFSTPIKFSDFYEGSNLNFTDKERQEKIKKLLNEGKTLYYEGVENTWFLCNYGEGNFYMALLGPLIVNGAINEKYDIPGSYSFKVDKTIYKKWYDENYNNSSTIDTITSDSTSTISLQKGLNLVGFKGDTKLSDLSGCNIGRYTKGQYNGKKSIFGVKGQNFIITPNNAETSTFTDEMGVFIFVTSDCSLSYNYILSK